MNAPLHQPIADRILDAFPSGSYALSALLRLMDIVESTEVPTAAVECRAQPRLLVNPEFLAQHAIRRAGQAQRTGGWNAKAVHGFAAQKLSDA